ncbi:MAG: transglycosylase SLT domain-containing protein [Dokdonella sp.]|uniref:transglycosylase SLT domain-containing protein n=1 Tax=Dokdonella sp. TaxID=2291710 RepID=UPI0025C05063|nr:transglycosylase SLT domain-containing protein [Dokdonella sp.]MBZ0222206.1 transglycosylase SLT domain-containing protein [Dokdonella sp.]MCC7256285.1 transglycosylase SLT domain-containing protein [Dokdonella sp.]
MGFRLYLHRRMRCVAPFLIASSLATASPVSIETQREAFRAALKASAQPASDDAQRWNALLRDNHYPLYPYVELAGLRGNLKSRTAAEIKAFLERFPDTLPANDLRKAWLRELARRGDWPRFRQFEASFTDTDLQCDALQARLAAGDKLDFAKDLEAIWSNDRALPDACTPVLAAARAQGALTDAELWARIERSATSGNTAAASDAAALLSGTARTEADRIVATLSDPATQLAKAKTWADSARNRDAISWGLARLARRNSLGAQTLWADLGARFKWDDTQKDRVLNAIALYRATSYSPDALARLKALPDAADDDATREWHVRMALISGDYAETLSALDRMTEVQKADARWRYLRARILGKLGREAEAQPILAEVAREANFHGFLAADWLDQPYSICADTLAGGEAAETRIAQQPDLARAFEFRALGMLREARREWTFAMNKLDDNDKRLAADRAYRSGWYDRAVFFFSADPRTQRLYEQRFPLGMADTMHRAAHDAGIDPSWAYGILRAESAWMSDARSSANAYGLMQLLPAVGKQVAKSLKLPFGGAEDLFKPEFNIQLGTTYLAQMADAFQGSPWLASAAYNAGEGAVDRWVAARGTLDPDFFVETIPYKETREYVARVMAFSVIYDWRLNGKVLTLSSRMPRIGQAYVLPDADTPRKAVICVPGGTVATPVAAPTAAQDPAPTPTVASPTPPAHWLGMR